MNDKQHTIENAGNPDISTQIGNDHQEEHFPVEEHPALPSHIRIVPFSKTRTGSFQ